MVESAGDEVSSLTVAIAFNMLDLIKIQRSIPVNEGKSL